MNRLTALSLVADCFATEVHTANSYLYIKTVTCNEGKADGSIFLFGVSNKKILSQP